ncbi:uncharacterized protein J5M81_013949 [Pluvialis apricaria]
MVATFNNNIKLMFLTVFKLVSSSAQLRKAQTGTNSKIGLRHRCNMTIGKTSAERDHGCLVSRSLLSITKKNKMSQLNYDCGKKMVAKGIKTNTSLCRTQILKKDHRCCCYSCCSPALRNWRCRRQGCSKGASYSRRRLSESGGVVTTAAAGQRTGCCWSDGDGGRSISEPVPNPAVVAKQPDLMLEMSATSEEPELFWDLSVLH